MSKGKFTTSEAKPLAKDDNYEPTSGMFRYSSVVGMILYLYGNTITDVSLAVNRCDQYMFSPKKSHKLVSDILVRYLNQTKDHGLLFNPNPDASRVDAYPYTNFSGM